MTSEYSPSPNPDPGSDEFQRALGDYLTRIERDGTVALDEFQRHHPEFADRLGRQLDWLAAHLGRSKEGLPENIGPFRVIQRLGTGGMGEVYLAEQSAPFQRVVALKVIRTDKASEGRVSRFLQEIQALASLSHDGIAKVFEAGHDAGRPYFTMEYVPGRPVTDYCSEERLGLRARLRLFMRICTAVEHAHRHGVLHRDLKPSNILVFGRPAEPTVKIIDFGLAKIVASGAETQRRTGTGQVLGTPDYMSPEQVAESGEHHVDTRTDVYSLGVVLYELLTGVLPLSLWQMEHNDFQALLRTILERQPSSPSVRVEELTDVSPSSPATGEGISPHRLSRLLAGDLDAIVMKALAKDAAKRYGSVGELAEDIRRHLHHEPIGARPATARYVLAKFVRRHRLGVAFAATLTVVTFTALIVIIVLKQQSISILERGDKFAAARYLDELRLTDSLPKPARPEYVDDLTQLLEQFERLEAERPRLQAFLATPDTADVSREQGWLYGKRANDVLRDAVDNAVRLLDVMARPDGEIDRLRLRIAWAKTVHARTVREHAAAWERVRAEVRDDKRYPDLDLPPQTGMVPLGPDPVTRWQEFALLLPDAELPHRTASGWEIGPHTCPVFVLLPGGKVTIGSQATDPASGFYDSDRDAWARGLQEIEIAPFFASRFEFTRGQWISLAPRTAYLQTGRNDPVDPVVDQEALQMLHVLLAWGMRMPTSEEWEYLARAGTDTAYSCGKDVESLEGNANVHDRSVAESNGKAEGSAAEWSDGYAETSPVGSFAPNAFGIYDVHGNAIEPAVLEGETGGELVLELRGGSWHQSPEAARITASIRWNGSPLRSIGVRPVISLQR